MQELPSGYYAVTQNGGSPAVFCYKETNYAVKEGVNLFYSLPEALAAAAEIPSVPLFGKSFNTPVILFSSGEHPVDRVNISKNVTLLGQNAGISPNTENGGNMPRENPQRQRGETVLSGSYWFGIFNINAAAVTSLCFDGFTFSAIRIRDTRQNGTVSDFSFCNIIHKGPCGDVLYKFAPTGEDSTLSRRILWENIRSLEYDDYGYGGNFVLLCAASARFSGICFGKTAQLFGLSNMTKSFKNYAPNGSTEIIIERSYFEDTQGENGISAGTRGIKDREFSLKIRECVFKNASRKNSPPLSLFLLGEGCRAELENCRFLDTRGNSGAAVCHRGDARRITLTGCEFSGFAATLFKEDDTAATAPEYINTAPRQTECEDSHTVLPPDKEALARMEEYYAGTSVRFGDLHVHTKCGGTSDGAYPLADWPAELERLGLSFAAVVDHRQLRGFFLPEWDKTRFIMGSEPAIVLSDRECGMTEFHCLMIVPDKYSLAMVFANFPEFEFRGDELTGSYRYPHLTHARVCELAKYIRSIGGVFVHAHPKTLLSSAQPLDYYFGERTYLETLYETYDSHASFKNYDLWVTLLNMGKRVYTSGCSDTHTAPKNTAVSAMYTREQTDSAYLENMRKGDLTAGAAGIKMFMNGAVMGSDVPYREGLTLTVKTDDYFTPAFDGGAYELRVYTDKGLAYAGAFSGKMPQTLTLAVKKRMYYRAEIFSLSREERVAIGNPIWLNYDE